MFRECEDGACRSQRVRWEAETLRRRGDTKPAVHECEAAGVRLTGVRRGEASQLRTHIAPDLPWQRRFDAWSDADKQELSTYLSDGRIRVRRIAVDPSDEELSRYERALDEFLDGREPVFALEARWMNSTHGTGTAFLLRTPSGEHKLVRHYEITHPMGGSSADVYYDDVEVRLNETGLLDALKRTFSGEERTVSLHLNGKDVVYPPAGEFTEWPGPD